jgi:hypothetical protein
MRWHAKTASSPPAYVEERISDLLRASDTARTSPSNAKGLLLRVVDQLSSHLDNAYLEDLMAAAGVVLDSPTRARQIIGLVVAKMREDKLAYEEGKDKPWLTWRP